MSQPDLSKLQVGGTVIYVDPVAGQHEALVTAVRSPTCINIVIVSDDANKSDTYGRQIERHTSLSHRSVMPVHGNYFMMPGDTPNPIVTPMSK